jgi:transposase
MARPLNLPEFFKTTDFKALYKLHGQRKYGCRLLAMCYLKQGKSIYETSQLMMKTEYTIREWVKLYKERGLNGLLSIRQGRGRRTTLPKGDEAKFKDTLDELGQSLKGGRLRGVDIQELLQSKFGVEYALSGVYALLERLGYSWITSRSIHPKANPALQEAFKKSVP